MPTKLAPWLKIVRERCPYPTDDQPDIGKPIRGPREAWSLLKGMELLETEHFVVLCLDAMHNVAWKETISKGLLDSSLVHPREVFRLAIAKGAKGIVLAHNHPSGEVSPSADDKAITTALVAAGRALDIPVQDHLIIGAGYFSFAEAGLL